MKQQARDGLGDDQQRSGSETAPSPNRRNRHESCPALRCLTSFAERKSDHELNLIQFLSLNALYIDTVLSSMREAPKRAVDMIR